MATSPNLLTKVLTESSFASRKRAVSWGPRQGFRQLAELHD